MNSVAIERRPLIGLRRAMGATTASVSRSRSYGLWLPPPKLHRRKIKY